MDRVYQICAGIHNKFLNEPLGQAKVYKQGTLNMVQWFPFYVSALSSNLPRCDWSLVLGVKSLHPSPVERQPQEVTLLCGQLKGEPL